MMHRSIGRAARTATVLAALLGVAACESSQPATRAGMALDRAGTATGNAVGTAGQATGAAVGNAGTYVKEKVTPEPPRGGY